MVTKRQKPSVGSEKIEKGIKVHHYETSSVDRGRQQDKERKKGTTKHKKTIRW